MCTLTETNSNLAKRRSYGNHQQFPMWNWEWGKDWTSRTQQIGENSTTEPPMHTWPQQIGIADWDSRQMGNWRLHQGLGAWSGGTISLLKLTCPWLESQLDQELHTKRADLSTKRNSTHRPWKWKKKNQKFVGTNACVSYCPRAVRSFLWIPSLPPVLLKNKIQLSKI